MRRFRSVSNYTARVKDRASAAFKRNTLLGSFAPVGCLARCRLPRMAGRWAGLRALHVRAPHSFPGVPLAL